MHKGLKESSRIPGSRRSFPGSRRSLHQRGRQSVCNDILSYYNIVLLCIGAIKAGSALGQLECAFYCSSAAWEKIGTADSYAAFARKSSGSLERGCRRDKVVQEIPNIVAPDGRWLFFVGNSHIRSTRPETGCFTFMRSARLVSLSQRSQCVHLLPENLPCGGSWEFALRMPCGGPGLGIILSIEVNLLLRFNSRAAWNALVLPLHLILSDDGHGERHPASRAKTHTQFFFIKINQIDWFPFKVRHSQIFGKLWVTKFESSKKLPRIYSLNIEYRAWAEVGLIRIQEWKKMHPAQSARHRN